MTEGFRHGVIVTTGSSKKVTFHEEVFARCLDGLYGLAFYTGLGETLDAIYGIG